MTRASRAVDHSLGFTGRPGLPVARPARRRSPPKPPHVEAGPPLEPGITLRFEAPIHTESEANSRGFWAKRHARSSDQQSAVTLLCRSKFGRPPAPPLRAVLTRIAERELDDDNLVSAFKAIRDAIAKWLGVNDKHRRLVRYSYEQERCAPGRFGIRVELSRMTEAP